MKETDLAYLASICAVVGINRYYKILYVHIYRKEVIAVKGTKGLKVNTMTKMRKSSGKLGPRQDQSGAGTNNFLSRGTRGIAKNRKRAQPNQ